MREKHTDTISAAGPLYLVDLFIRETHVFRTHTCAPCTHIQHPPQQLDTYAEGGEWERIKRKRNVGMKKKRRKSYSHAHRRTSFSHRIRYLRPHRKNGERFFSQTHARNFSIEMNFHPFYFIRTDFSPPSTVRLGYAACSWCVFVFDCVWYSLSIYSKITLVCGNALFYLLNTRLNSSSNRIFFIIISIFIVVHSLTHRRMPKN